MKIKVLDYFCKKNKNKELSFDRLKFGLKKWIGVGLKIWNMFLVWLVIRWTNKNQPNVCLFVFSVLVQPKYVLCSCLHLIILQNSYWFLIIKLFIWLLRVNNYIDNPKEPNPIWSQSLKKKTNPNWISSLNWIKFYQIFFTFLFSAFQK